MSKYAAEHALSTSTHGMIRERPNTDADVHRSWKFEGSADEQAAQILRLVSSHDLTTESRSANLAHASYLKRRGLIRRVFFVVAIVAYVLLAVVLVVTALLAESQHQSIIATAGALLTAVIASGFALFTEREVRQRRRTMRRTQELIDIYMSRYASKKRENDSTEAHHEGAAN